MAANSRFAIAVHVLTSLAYRGAQGEAWTSSDKLAESVRTNPVVVRRVVAALGRAGLVESQAGRGGGARLARSPADVTLAAVYRAVTRAREDSDAPGAGPGAGDVLAHNPNPPNRACAVSCAMPDALAPVFAEVDAAVVDALARRTLADVLTHVPTGVAPRAGGSARARSRRRPAAISSRVP